MEQYIMKGGNPLVGEVTIGGAKNAALGILAAAIMTDEDVLIDNLAEFKEAGACGTAAVITPIGGIQYKGKLHVFHSETEVGPMTKKLYDTLCAIQFGDMEAPSGWIIKA